MARLEHDFLGEVEVPDEAYYGVQTVRALENFSITGYRMHPLFIRAMAMVKKAAALANMEAGLLDPVIGKAIVQAANEVIEGKLNDQFVVDPIQGGAGTSANMNMNEVLANRALEILNHPRGSYHRISPNTHVNMSQSTNDVFPTAIRITALHAAWRLLETLNRLQDAFQSKGVEFDHVVKMGRTHLQDAVPIRLGQEFRAYAKMIQRDINRLRKARELLYEVNIGATAIGTSLNADPIYIEAVIRHLQEISEIPHLHLPEDMVDGTQNTDALVELSGALRVLATNLGKIMNDLRLMASGPRCGLNEINLPPLQPGSSIMPGKVNPVMAEAVNQVCYQVLGNDLTIGLASQAGQFELNVMEPVMAFNLIQSLDILRNVLDSFIEKCLLGITANEERCRDAVEHSIGIVTALSPHLGYESTAEIAREAYRTGRSVRDICLERGLFTSRELDEILSVRGMTEPGIAARHLLQARR